MCARLRTMTRTSISRKPRNVVKSGFQILYAVEQFSSLFSNDKLKARAHIRQPMIRLPCACRGKTAVRFPTNSSHICGAELALEEMLCTTLGIKGSLRHEFSPFFDPMAML